MLKNYLSVMKDNAEIVIGRNISVNIKSVSSDFIQNIKNRLTVDNPVYLKNKKMGFWTGNIPKVIKFWKNCKNWLILPRGFKNSLFKELKIRNLPYKVTDLRIINKPVRFYSTIKLRPYQIPAVERAIKFEQGIIEAPCGAGKTVVGIEIIARAGQNSLWLVHTKELAEQAIERIKHFLNIPADKIGFLGNNHWKMGEYITVGMVQTLSKRNLTSDFIKHFGLVILDEAHHTPAYSFMKVIEQFPSYYRFGFTATPYRADGLGMLMYYQIGYTVFKITQEDLSVDGNLVKPSLKRINTDFYYEYRDDFTSMIDSLTENKKRNNLIINILIDEIKGGHYCLILSDRVKHCQELNNLLKVLYPEARCTVLTGDLSKSARTRIVNLVNEGKLNAIFATSRLAEEGLDWKILDRLFLTCPSRSKRKIQQSIGRIQRPCEGKADAIVYDFVDARIDILASQYKSRFFSVYETLLSSSHEENILYKKCEE